MLKKTVFVLLSFNFLATQPEGASNSSQNNTASMPTVEDNSSKNGTTVFKYIFWGTVGAGAATVTVMYAPIIIPIAIVNAKAGVVIATAKVVAATAATKATAGAVVIPVIKITAAVAPAAKVISASIIVAEIVQPYVAPTEKQELQQIVTQQSEKHAQAAGEFKTCMDRHADPDATIVPKECEAIAMQYILYAHGKQYSEKLIAPR